MSAWPSRWLTATKRQAVDAGDRLAGQQAHDQAADQAGAGGGGDGGEVAKADAGLAHRALDQEVELLDVGPGCYLGHDAAVGRVLGELGEDGCREDRAVAAQEGRRGLVAARLDAKDDGPLVEQRRSLRMVEGDP